MNVSETDRQRRKQQIINLTMRLVAGQIETGTLDPNDDAALRKATKQAAADATATLNAVEDFLS